MTMFRFLAFLIAALIAAPAVAQAPEVPQSRDQITMSFAPIVKQAAPAVVNIYTQRVVQQRLSPMFQDPFFQQFFFNNGTMPGLNRQRMENSLGSGVIVRSDGLIVTSKHVIDGADEIRVVLADKREFDATLVTSDDHSDLAVLRIDTKGEHLPFLELKDSDQAEIGDLVLAIGNPFGVGQSVTSGIISAITHRAVNGSGDLDYFIQTDAAINPGNSGGALVTMDGKLVAINAAIYTRSGGNMGIGFAVPSNMVRVVLNAVEHGQKNIVRPWIGIEGQPVTQTIATSLGMTQPTGVLVNRLSTGSPAIAAGMQVGDVIVAVNGRTIEDAETFRYRLATLPVGSTVDFTVLRKGQKVDLSVQLIAPPENTPREATRVSGANPLGGAMIENLSPAVMEELGLHGVEHGVVVTGVKEGAAASNLGLQPGDIILSINNVAINDVATALETVKSGTHSWKLLMQRGDEKMTIMVGG
jgi:serine protease Do